MRAFIIARIHSAFPLAEHNVPSRLRYNIDNVASRPSPTKFVMENFVVVTKKNMQKILEISFCTNVYTDIQVRTLL